MASERPAASELKAKLSPLEYEVTQCGSTERAFTGAYWDAKEPGLYRCRCCESPLFRSETKFDSGTGWPSFFAPLSDDVVEVRMDHSHGMVREEALCANCGAHLGHRFPDGPAPTGQRYCMNSASLKLERDADGSTDAIGDDPGA